MYLRGLLAPIENDIKSKTILMKYNYSIPVKKTMRLAAMAVASFLVVSAAHAQSTETVHSNPNVRLGEKALLDSDFKTAAGYLKKALPAEANDPNVLYMLGYSEYHSGDYRGAVQSFQKVIQLAPENATAYYYRAKANNTLAVSTEIKSTNANRERMLQEAIVDYAKAIELTPKDVKLYQNRAVAYRDLGILLGTAGTPNFNKGKATEAYDKSILDFEEVLELTPGKKDIETEIKKAKVYRDNL